MGHECGKSVTCITMHAVRRASGEVVCIEKQGSRTVSCRLLYTRFTEVLKFTGQEFHDQYRCGNGGIG